MAEIDWEKYEREGDFEPEDIKKCLKELQEQRYKKILGKHQVTFFVDGDNGPLLHQSIFGKPEAQFFIEDVLRLLSGQEHGDFLRHINIESDHPGRKKITLSGAEILGIVANNVANFPGSSDYRETQVGQ